MSTAASGSDAISGKIGDSIILEEEIDPNYEPSQDEVVEKVFAWYMQRLWTRRARCVAARAWRG